MYLININRDRFRQLGYKSILVRLAIDSKFRLEYGQPRLAWNGQTGREINQDYFFANNTYNSDIRGCFAINLLPKFALWYSDEFRFGWVIEQDLYPFAQLTARDEWSRRLKISKMTNDAESLAGLSVFTVLPQALSDLKQKTILCWLVTANKGYSWFRIIENRRVFDT